MQRQWRAQAAWLDQALAQSDYLAGDAPGLADIAAYMNVWFLGGAVRQTTEQLMAGFDRLNAWRATRPRDRPRRPPRDDAGARRWRSPGPPSPPSTPTTTPPIRSASRPARR